MSLIPKFIRKLIDKSQFIFDSPITVIFALFTNPFFFVRRNLYKNITYFAKQMDGKFLDFGCGCKPYEKYFSHCSEYVGCDIEISGHDHCNEKIDVFYDGKTLPFENETFDNVFSSEVFEHIFNLEPIVKELNRVLKIGGGCLVTVPFVWNEHEVPYDFGRYTSFGLADLLQRNGFKIIEQKKSTNYIQVLFQMWIEYLRFNFEKIPLRLLRKFLYIIFIIPAVLTGCLFSLILPKNNSFYADNIVYAKKIKNI